MKRQRINEEIALARFSENLKQVRTKREISQEELADRAEIHRTQVSMIESSIRSPRLATLISLAGALEVPISELLDGITFTPSITRPGGFVVGPENERAGG